MLQKIIGACRKAIDDYNMIDDEKIDFVAARILKLYRPAFEELAK